MRKEIRKRILLGHHDSIRHAQAQGLARRIPKAQQSCDPATALSLTLLPSYISTSRKLRGLESFLGCLGRVLGAPPWGVLGATLGLLGGVLERLGSRSVLGRLGPLEEATWPVSEVSWGLLELSWDVLEES